MSSSSEPPRPTSITTTPRASVVARSRADDLFIVAAALLVALRAIPPVIWEQLNFDSDQAIVGIMAKRIATGRDFPIYFYGQKFLFTLDAYLAAPLFAAHAPNVALLKLPSLVMSIATGALLVHLLRKEAGLRAWQALVASLFFLLPPLLPATRLVSVEGGAASTFLATLILWLLRRRPVAFGALAGAMALQRPFAMYAVFAAYAIDLAHEPPPRTRALARRWPAGVAFVAVQGVLRLLASHSANAFGDRAPFTIGPIFSSIPQWLGENLPDLFGARSIDPVKYNVISNRPTGSSVAILLFPVLVLASYRLWKGRASLLSSRDRSADFPLFLMIVGALASLVYVIAGNIARDHMAIRYTILTLYFPVGLVALTFRFEAERLFVRIVTATVLGWALMNGAAHLSVIDEYVTAQPAARMRNLATALEQHGMTRGMAGYWVAYATTFLSNERVILGSTQQVRIREYQSLVAASDGAVLVQATPCELPSRAIATLADFQCCTIQK